MSTGEALAAARYLAAAGVPMFLARPAGRGGWDPAGGTGGSGFWVPSGWQRTEADPGVVDRWEPGMAVGAVMGHRVDGLDVDPRNGGMASLADLPVPRVHGVQVTPSGGWHGLIAPLGTGSRDAIRPGIDLKGGKADGTGRGFLWIAPTVKLSKATGELAAYRWERPPMLDGIDGDRSGERLAGLVHGLRAPAAQDRAVHTGPTSLSSGRCLMALVEVVLRAPEGERNRCLHWAGCRAAEHAAAGHLSWQAAEQALAEAAAAIGLDVRETAATLKSARKVAS